VVVAVHPVAVVLLVAVVLVVVVLVVVGNTHIKCIYCLINTQKKL
jgi:hypothetical protein